MKNSIIQVFAFLFLLAGFAAAQQLGAIHGTVVDPQGRAVGGAIVRCHSFGGKPLVKSVPEAETDGNGRFTITGIGLGEYVVIAMKELDGYPNPRWSFYNRREPVHVTLTSDAPIFDGVQLVLEPKGATIAGAITDAATGSPVAATLHMWRVDDESVFLDQAVKGSFRVLIPADTAVRFSVRAPGYREWFFSGASEASRTPAITGHSDESQTLQVKLVPVGE